MRGREKERDAEREMGWEEERKKGRAIRRYGARERGMKGDREKEKEKARERK